MNKKIFRSIAIIPLLISSTFAVSDEANEITRSVNDSIVEAGDMMQILLPATGLFAAWMYDDLEGAKQLALSTATSQAIVHSTKNIIGRSRPNDSSWNSFPSGHTAAAFSGAAFLQTRYGSTWGIPAYAGAFFVGASRIHGNRHYVGDVTAGAGIAFLVNQYFVSEYHIEGVSFEAQATDGGIALGVAVTNNAFNNERTQSDRYQFSPKHFKNRFELGIGANLADSSAQAGADIFLADSELIDEYQPFAYVNYNRQLDNGNGFEVEFLPSETRRRGPVSEPFIVDGVEYNQGENVFTAFRHWILGSNIYKGYQIDDTMNIDVGLGLYIHWFSFDIDNDTGGGKYATEDHWRAMPNLSVRGRYSFTEKVSLPIKTQYQWWDNDSYLYAEVGINYKLNPAWDIGLMYGYSDTNLDDVTFKTQYEGNYLFLTLANSF